MIKFQEERDNEIPCMNTDCQYFDETFDQNCCCDRGVKGFDKASAEEDKNCGCGGEPAIISCREYIPEKG